MTAEQARIAAIRLRGPGDENPAFLNLAICRELLKARADKASARFIVAGRDREIGDGFVAVVNDHGSLTQ